jgi:hypothetical protein
MKLDYEDLQPGISESEDVHGIRRFQNIIVGVFVVIIGIILMPLPGPGIAIVLVGLNLIKPDNRLVRYIRARTPGIPEEGPIPRNSIIFAVVMMIAASIISFFYGDVIFGPMKEFAAPVLDPIKDFFANIWDGFKGWF